MRHRGYILQYVNLQNWAFIIPVFDPYGVSGYGRSVKLQQGALSGSFHPSFNSLKVYSIGNKNGIAQITARCGGFTKTKSFVNN